VKLSGWKRIGIVISVMWIVGSVFFYTPESNLRTLITDAHVQCDELRGNTKAGFDACNKEADDAFAKIRPTERLELAIVAFVPVPLGWGFVYLVLFVVRWVKSGFQAGQSSN